MMNTTPPTDFEQDVRKQLHALADHAPTHVRSTSNVALRTTVDERPPKRRIAAIGAAVIALGGGAALTTIAATGTDGGGQSTPESAVLDFVEAIENRDVLGALDVLDPGESAAMIDVAIEGVGEAERVGLLTGTDLNEVGGATAGIDGLVLSTDQVAPDVAVVNFEAGTIDIGFDLSVLPFSDQLREQVADQPTTTNSAIDLADETYQLATVQRDGEWYVSVGYTIAETARRGTDEPFPLDDVSAAGVSTGFDTPEAAATEFWQRAADLDVRGLIDTVAPGEADAIARYAPLWLDSADALAADARDAGFTVAVNDLTFTASGDDDVRRMTPVGYTIDGTFPPVEQYDFDEPFVSTAPTLVTAFDPASGEERFIVIDAGEPVPDTLDIADFETGWPEDIFERGGVINQATLLPDGTLQTFWSTPSDEAPDETAETFNYVFSQGCTTISGSAFSDAESGFFGPLPSGIEDLGDGVWRSCSNDSLLNSVSAFSILFVGRGGLSAPEVPSIDVIEIDGRWYVSPIRTVFASVFDATTSIDDGQAFSIDSPLALIIYGTDRTMLDNMLRGRSIDTIAADCRDIVIVEADVVAGVIDDVSAADAQRCSEGGWFSYGDTAVAVEVPPSTAVVGD